MANKKSSSLANKVKQKVKQKVRQKTEKEVKKVVRKIPLKYKIAALIVLLLCVVSTFFLPEDPLYESLAKPHDMILAVRNRTIRALHLPISCYGDHAQVLTAGRDPVMIYFAPSPVICPALCEFINNAVSTIDLCAYDLKHHAIADALIHAKNRGIKVRIVTDSDYMKNDAISRLSQAGIPVVQDRSPSLMHNKFVIVDSRYVWTGSYNLTYNCTEKNDNNAISFESPEIAAGYQKRFEQYWNQKFSTKGEVLQDSKQTFIGKIPAQYAFSPVDQVEKILLDQLSNAEKKVDIMAFSFTGAKLAVKLRELMRKGVKVRCIFDVGQSKNKASRDEYLKKIGAKVYYSPNRKGKLHHKVMIIDDKTVITGSYNFSKNAASRNDENILIVHSTSIAAHYTREMNRCIRGIKGY